MTSSPTSAPEAPRPPATRRRGAALLAAIHAATLEEVADVGFEAATVEGIAARAGAGKASLYKRWGSREEIVLAALEALDDPLTDLRQRYGGDEPVVVREALVDILTRYAAGLDTPIGRALRVLMTQRERHPQLYDRVHDLTVGPRRELMTHVLDTAARQGDVRPECITPWVVGAGPRLMIAHHMERGRVTADDVEAVVDEILLPALGAR